MKEENNKQKTTTEEKKTPEAKKDTKKVEVVNKPKVTEAKKETKKEPKKAPKVKTFSAAAYCNIIGATKSIRFVANLKFKNAGKKSGTDWKEIFLKEDLIQEK